MKSKLILLLISLSMMKVSQAQDKSLPYYELPEYSKTYTAGTVAARMVDGLGFRYYWATEGLRAEDLAYKPSEDGRTTGETIDHIYGLCRVIVNSTLKLPNDGSQGEELTFAEKRKKTLEYIKIAADILRQSDDISQFKIIFKRGENTSEFPFWNQLNGPIEDAVWHCGQVVLLRRASGNPYNSKASVFSGKVRD
ncbi:hypothetical protein MNBD_BACTEROID02-1471 [hydrothermal vent metagenome]|uniref:DinB-like domain-containing protein n=1 Tax=hydrothermal vent metagenome TaxID=652676 RepID=A0A3B0QU54_9ZZZZ